jgi:membrane-associated phospholipid phosphatase
MYQPSIYIYILFIFIIIALIRRGYFRHLFHEMFKEIKENPITIISLLLTVVITMLLIDRPLNGLITSLKMPFLKDVSKFADKFGNGEVHFSICLVVVTVSHFNEKYKIAKLFSISLISSVLAGILGNILKIIFTRERPFVDLNPFHVFAFSETFFKGNIFNYQYMSLPSGHTITVFALLAPLFLFVKNKYLKGLILIPGLIVAFGRVYDNVHWPSDVLLGALVGFFIGKIIYTINREKLSLSHDDYPF